MSARDIDYCDLFSLTSHLLSVPLRETFMGLFEQRG
jgi:hypothetical protein